MAPGAKPQVGGAKATGWAKTWVGEAGPSVGGREVWWEPMVLARRCGH